MAETEVLPNVEHEEKTGSESELEPGWLVICWNDPVNLMTYVTHVFQTVFGWNKQKAEHHMLQVHRQGKSAHHDGKGRALRARTSEIYIARDPGARVVKLRHAGKNGYVFHLHPREKQLLVETVELYPLVPASHHRLSRNRDSNAADENQRLLEESLATHRQEKRQEVLAMLSEPKRFCKTKSGLELTLSAAEIEWVLQVLNDVRVGSWLALGEPEPGAESVGNEENAQLYFALEICGMFQSQLLAALGVTESQDWMRE